MVASHISQPGVAGSNCSHRGHASFWVRRVKIANIDTSWGSLERRASAILSRVRCSAAGKLNLGLQALVHVPFTATQDRQGNRQLAVGEAAHGTRVHSGSQTRSCRYALEGAPPPRDQKPHGHGQGPFRRSQRVVHCL
jgi:hypothetical protein